MLQTNKTYSTTVDGFTSDGLGVCHVEGCAVFVANAVPGETYRLRITRAGKTSASGVIEQILVRSPHRVNRACPYAKQCGGCDFWHMDYETELAIKRQRVADALQRIGGVAVADVPILSADGTCGYRNKAQFPVGLVQNRPVAGFYKAHSHQIVEIDRCRIQTACADTVRQTVMDYVRAFHVPCYNESTRRGLLRHICVRRGAVSGQVLVCLVVNGTSLPAQKQLLSMLQERVEGLQSVVLSVNTSPNNTILGTQILPLLGDGTIEDTLCGLRFRLSARSFYQVNHAQAQHLYQIALDFADLHGEETALDLYCGAGTITLSLARRAGRVIGVETVDAAIADAEENARRNHIENVRFFCADAGHAALRLASEGIRPAVVVVDPPRKGLSPDVISAIAAMAPRRLVYVSCDPATLARDVRLLSAYGYAAQAVQAVDMFPRCAHVETVCLLSKLNTEHHIEIDLDMDEMDLIVAEQKASYEEIKEYVLEHSGFKVSSLYIAQVKRKCGLIERQNYNKPKSEDAEQLQCPPEKEAAIMDALRHFQMIS